MTTNLESLLSTNCEEIKEPLRAPIGTYIGKIGTPRFRTLNKKDGGKSDCVDFPIEFLSAQEDVDSAELEKAGGAEGKKTMHTFFLTEESLFYLKRFIQDHVGVDTENKTLGQAIAETQGAIVGFHFNHQTDERNPEKVYGRIDQTLKA